jgi:hypothetical protein
MRYTLLASLIVVACVANASTSDTLSRTSPFASFSTTKTGDAFAQCVLDAVGPDFPASATKKVAGGQTITVANAERVTAVIEVSEPFKGDGAMVLIHSPSARQPGKDPTVKSARNCQ